MADLEAIQFEQYEFIQHLGAGGMAEVYRMRQRSAFGREVAIKVIKRGLAEDPIFRDRFLREGQATAKLSHPHILQLIELGQEPGPDGERLFLVMPYVADGTLRDLLAMTDGPLPIETIRTLFPQLCEAVQYAHEQGVIHRDIKPSNILLLHERHVLLADFGIALDTEDIRLTNTGMGLGTPEYTAPEQAMGRADRRSDVYSLGIVLFEMLTGKVPFTGGTPFEVLFKQTTAPVPRLREVYPDLPRRLNRLDAVIQRALAKEPDERFQTASALRQAFRRALARPTPASLERVTPVVMSETGAVASSAPGANDGEQATPGASMENWSPPAGFFPLPAEAAALEGAGARGEAESAGTRFPQAPAAGGAAARGMRRGRTMAGATGDPRGEQPTVPALVPGGLPRRARRYPRKERTARTRRNLLAVVAVLAVLLFGGAVVILGNNLIHQIGDNVPGATSVPVQHTAGAQHTPTVGTTQSPQSRPTNTPTATSSASPSPTSNPSPSPTDTPQSSPTSNPSPIPTLPVPIPTGG